MAYVLVEISTFSDIAARAHALRPWLLQENEYYRRGDDRINRSSARIVVATNSSLEDQIAKGTFRNDLYYRLCSHHIHILPLRERKKRYPAVDRIFCS